MAKIPSISWSSSYVRRIERIEPRRPSLPKGDTRFSIATFGKMLWGSCKRMRIRMKMRRRRRRNGSRPRARGNRRGLLTVGAIVLDDVSIDT